MRVEQNPPQLQVARGLQQAGYATDPFYGEKLLRIINGLDAHQREHVRKHWGEWVTQLRALQVS